jgi:hypothetical protein
MADVKHCLASPKSGSDFTAINFDVLNSYLCGWKSNWFVCRMNKDVINLCYYFSCKIFALDHWRVEISTHWSSVLSVSVDLVNFLALSWKVSTIRYVKYQYYCVSIHTTFVYCWWCRLQSPYCVFRSTKQKPSKFVIFSLRKTFLYTQEQAEKLFIELMLCVKKKELVIDIDLLWYYCSFYSWLYRTLCYVLV